MKKSLSLLVVLLAILVTDALYMNNRYQVTSAKKPKLDAIVRLTKGNHTVCTGTVVNQHTIITAAHCVLIQTVFGPQIDMTPFDIRTDSDTTLGVTGIPYEARVQLDQALITGDFHLFEYKNYITDVKELNKLGNKPITLYSCGYPLGGPLYCTPMEFDELYDFMWAVHGLLLPGMSGGPVMLKNGTIIGVNVAVSEDRSFISPIFNLDLEFKK